MTSQNSKFLSYAPSLLFGPESLQRYDYFFTATPDKHHAHQIKTKPNKKGYR